MNTRPHDAIKLRAILSLLRQVIFVIAFRCYIVASYSQKIITPSATTRASVFILSPPVRFISALSRRIAPFLFSTFKDVINLWLSSPFLPFLAQNRTFSGTRIRYRIEPRYRLSFCFCISLSQIAFFPEKIRPLVPNAAVPSARAGNTSAIALFRAISRIREPRTLKRGAKYNVHLQRWVSEK